MKLYLYCLSDEVEPCAIEEARGIAGAPAQLVLCGAVKAVVSEAGDTPVAVTRGNVLAHEQVIRRVLAKTTPLPFRFGTVVTREELERYIETRAEEIASLLERVRGAVEMGVKVMWDREAIRREWEGRGEIISGRGEPDEATGPGRAFLLAKQREGAASELFKKHAECIAVWLGNRVNSVVREAIVSVRPADALVIVAAHLVERAQIVEYRERLKELRLERGDLRFLTSGVWPPYSFSHI